MPAYVVNQFSITDQDMYKEYQKVGAPSIKQYGGRVLAAGTDVIDLEGKTFPDGPAARVIILEFDDLEAARRWYLSPEYQSAILIRERCSKGRVFIVNGLNNSM
jgi:uncharacterized protein (DUF1330 family)